MAHLTLGWPIDFERRRPPFGARGCLTFQEVAMPDICAHLEELEDPGRKPVTPSGRGCKECLEAGDEWVHLRLCMACGHVGCCDSSPNKHATRHSHRTHH